MKQALRQLMVAWTIGAGALGAATLTGQVTCSDGQTPVAHAVLDLFADPDHPPLRTAQVDGQGRFCLVDLPAGSYQLRLSAEGFCTDWYALRLSENRELGPLPLRLYRPGTVNGRVLKDTGEPLRETAIHLYAGDLHAGWQTVQTDAEGRYHLAGVRPGRPTLMAFAPGYAETQVPGVTIREGEEVNAVDIVLRPAGSLAFRLLARDGKTPLAGRRLSYRLRPQEAPVAYQEKTWPNASTDESGRCFIARLQPGTYQLEVVLDGLHLARTAMIRAGETLELDLVLAGGKIQGQVLSDKGQPIPDAQVFLTSRDWFEQHGQYALTPLPSYPGSSGGLITRTDESGRYCLEAVPDGRQTVVVLATGYARSAREVKVQDHAAVQGVDFNLPETGAGELTLRIYLPETGQPLAESPVTVRVARQTPGGEYGLQRQAKTDAQGQVDLGRFDTGRYDVSAKAEGYAAGIRQRLELNPGDHLNVAVRLQRGGEVTGWVLQSPAGSPVAGARVEFLPQESFDLWRDQPPLPEPFPLLRGGITYSGPDGRYHIPALEPGLYAARVLVAGEPVAWQENISVEEGKIRRDQVLSVAQSPALIRRESRADQGPAEQRNGSPNVHPPRKEEAKGGERPLEVIRSLREGPLKTLTPAIEELDEKPKGSPPEAGSIGGPPGPAGTGGFPAESQQGIAAGLRGAGGAGRGKGQAAGGSREKVYQDGKANLPGQSALRKVQPLALGSISGRIVARDDTHPLRQTQIEISLERQEQGSRVLSYRVVQTDAEGYFTLDHVPPGLYNLYLYAAGYAPAQAQGVVVSRGQPTEPVEVHLQLGGTLRGQIANLQNEPIAGAEVLWERTQQALTGKGRVQAGLRGRAGTLTGADGTYVVRELSPGTYRVGAQHRDYLPSLTEGVEVRRDKDTMLNFRLSRGGALAGRIFQADGQTPCPNGVVQATPAVLDLTTERFFAGGQQSRDRLTTTADENGNYRLTGLRPGVYRLTAWDVFGRLGQKRGVIVHDGQTLAEVNLRLEGPSPAPAASPVRVRVVGPDGATPIPDADVFMLPTETSFRGGSSGEPQAQAYRKTNSQGEAIFDQMSPGEARIVAERADFAATIQQAQVFSGAENVVTVQLRQGGEIAGRVLTAAPYTADRLEVLVVPVDQGLARKEGRVPLPTRGRGTVRSDYTYHLARIAPGHHTVLVYDRPTGDLLAVRTGVPVEEGNVTSDLELQVAGPLTLVGRVTRADNGAPVPRASITARLLWADSGEERTDFLPVRRTTWTDDEGRFELSCLPLGRWQVEAAAPGLARWVTAVDVPAGGTGSEDGGDFLGKASRESMTRAVALVLPVGGSVRGQVTLRETRETVPGLRVLVVGEESLETVTTSDGQFRLDHLLPGPHTLIAVADGLRTVTEAVVEVQEGQETVGAEIRVTRDE